MIGYFIIDSFLSPKDSAGFETRANVSNKMDMNFKGVLYLPPYLRKSQSNISEGDSVFAIIDDVSGIGAAICGIDDADFGYFFDADINIKQKLVVDKDTEIKDKLNVSNNITSTSGDVMAGSISLKTHTHSATLGLSGSADLATGTLTGSAIGTTKTPS